MKIGLISARYAPEFEGGSERVVRALARALSGRGHSVRVVAGTDRLRGERDVLREQVDGIEVARIPLVAHEPFDLELARPRVEALVVEELRDRELVHVHHWSSLSQHLVRRLAPSLPVVVTLHDLFATCPRFFRSSPARLACPPRGEFHACALCIAPDARPLEPPELEARLAARARDFEAELAAAARWVVPSRTHGERLAGLIALDPARRVVLPPGLTRALVRPERQAPEVSSFLRLLHFGNLCAEKGTLDLVESVRQLDSDLVELTLLGRMLEPGFAASVERLRGTARVRILGSFDTAALTRAAAQADLALFPSRAYESYGLVVDEAHALGLPVWASNRGAFHERLLPPDPAREMPGELCLQAGDPAAWTHALRHVLDRREELEGLAARVASLSVPGAEDSARLHETLYDEVLGERRA